MSNRCLSSVPQTASLPIGTLDFAPEDSAEIYPGKCALVNE